MSNQINTTGNLRVDWYEDAPTNQATARLLNCTDGTNIEISMNRSQFWYLLVDDENGLNSLEKSVNALKDEPIATAADWLAAIEKVRHV